MNSQQTNSAWLKRIAALAVAGVALFGVAGCSGGQDSGASPGTAFVFDGQATSERELTEATNQMTLLTGMPQARADVAWGLATAQAVLTSVGIDTEAAEAEVQATVEGYLAEINAPIPIEELSGPVRDIVLVSALQAQGLPINEQVVQQLIATSDLKMSPRYEVR